MPGRCEILRGRSRKRGIEKQAVHFLQLYADMGMTLDPSGPIYKSFSGVRSGRGVRIGDGAGASSSVLDSVPELKRNEAAVTQGSLAFTLSAFESAGGGYWLRPRIAPFLF